MLSSIKRGINKKIVNEREKIYLPDDITYYLPSLCWNIEMGERFMERTYQWMFPKRQIIYFTKNPEDAYWTIDKKDFTIVPRKSNSSRVNKVPKIDKIENPWYINVSKDKQYFDVGDFYEKRNNYEKAEKLYKKALEINPKYMRAYVALGKLYLKQQRYEEAQAMLKN